MQIRILVLAPKTPPKVHTVTNDSWRTWYPLVDHTTHIFQTIALKPGLDLLSDEEGGFKHWEPNVYVPARAPQVDPTHFDIVMWQKETKSGRRLMEPNEPGIGFHEILGTCIIARRHGAKYVDLTDQDIADVQKFYEAHQTP